MYHVVKISNLSFIVIYIRSNFLTIHEKVKNVILIFSSTYIYIVLI